MLPVKSIYLVSLYVLFGAYRLTPSGGTARPERIRWIVEKSSTMSIAGHTNLSKFCCQVTGYTGPDTLAVKDAANVKEPGVCLQGSLRIYIKDFDCRNRIMTSEFKQTLKYQQYPQLIISFLSLQRLPSGGPDSGSVKGWVEIGLAGTSRKFEIDYTSSRFNGNNLELVGVRAFGFSDFGLRPPRKMGGLVRVDDQLHVQFRLCLHQIN